MIIKRPEIFDIHSSGANSAKFRVLIEKTTKRPDELLDRCLYLPLDAIKTDPTLIDDVYSGNNKNEHRWIGITQNWLKQAVSDEYANAQSTSYSNVEACMKVVCAIDNRREKEKQMWKAYYDGEIYYLFFQEKDGVSYYNTKQDELVFGLSNAIQKIYQHIANDHTDYTIVCDGVDVAAVYDKDHYIREWCDQYIMKMFEEHEKEFGNF